MESVKVCNNKLLRYIRSKKCIGNWCQGNVPDEYMNYEQTDLDESKTHYTSECWIHPEVDVTEVKGHSLDEVVSLIKKICQVCNRIDPEDIYMNLQNGCIYLHHNDDLDQRNLMCSNWQIGVIERVEGNTSKTVESDSK